MLKDGGEPTLDNVLQPGKNMVAAGYCMYGSSCTVHRISFLVCSYKFFSIDQCGSLFHNVGMGCINSHS